MTPGADIVSFVFVQSSVFFWHSQLPDSGFMGNSFHCSYLAPLAEKYRVPHRGDSYKQETNMIDHLRFINQKKTNNMYLHPNLLTMNLKLASLPPYISMVNLHIGNQWSA
jgi:hypothetical protein